MDNGNYENIYIYFLFSSQYFVYNKHFSSCDGHVGQAVHVSSAGLDGCGGHLGLSQQPVLLSQADCLKVMLLWWTFRALAGRTQQ